MMMMERKVIIIPVIKQMYDIFKITCKFKILGNYSFFKNLSVTKAYFKQLLLFDAYMVCH